jgi:hypothetical protein
VRSGAGVGVNCENVNCGSFKSGAGRKCEEFMQNGAVRSGAGGK